MDKTISALFWTVFKTNSSNNKEWLEKWWTECKNWERLLVCKCKMILRCSFQSEELDWLKQLKNNGKILKLPWKNLYSQEKLIKCSSSLLSHRNLILKKKNSQWILLGTPGVLRWTKFKRNTPHWLTLWPCFSNITLRNNWTLWWKMENWPLP